MKRQTRLTYSKALVLLEVYVNLILLELTKSGISEVSSTSLKLKRLQFLKMCIIIPDWVYVQHSIVCTCSVNFTGNIKRTLLTEGCHPSLPTL